jgi:hypothetical protein
MKSPLLAILLLLAAALSASAMSFIDGPLSEIVKVSEYVFAGEVVGVRMTDGKRKPVTDPEARTGPGLDNTIWLDVAVDRDLILKAPASKIPERVSVSLWTTRHCTLGQIKEADHSKFFFLLDKEFKLTYPGDFPISIEVERRLQSIIRKQAEN